jgi:hypothetical protein
MAARRGQTRGGVDRRHRGPTGQGAVPLLVGGRSAGRDRATMRLIWWEGGEVGTSDSAHDAEQLEARSQRSPNGRRFRTHERFYRGRRSSAAGPTLHRAPSRSRRAFTAAPVPLGPAFRPAVRWQADHPLPAIPRSVKPARSDRAHRSRLRRRSSPRQPTINSSWCAGGAFHPTAVHLVATTARCPAMSFVVDARLVVDNCDRSVLVGHVRPDPASVEDTRRPGLLLPL